MEISPGTFGARVDNAARAGWSAWHDCQYRGREWHFQDDRQRHLEQGWVVGCVGDRGSCWRSEARSGKTGQWRWKLLLPITARRSYGFQRRGADRGGEATEQFVVSSASDLSWPELVSQKVERDIRARPVATDVAVTPPWPSTSASLAANIGNVDHPARVATASRIAPSKFRIPSLLCSGHPDSFIPPRVLI
jgi:hypothetical protein